MAVCAYFIFFFMCGYRLRQSRLVVSKIVSKNCSIVCYLVFMVHKASITDYSSTSCNVACTVKNSDICIILLLLIYIDVSLRKRSDTHRFNQLRIFLMMDSIESHEHISCCFYFRSGKILQNI